MTDRLLTPEQAADVLSIPRSTVVSMARGGGIPNVKIGRAYRFPEAQLHAWIEARTSYSPPDGAATTPGQRGGVGLSRARKAKAVGRRGDGGLEPRGSSDPKGALRIVRARGEGNAA